MGIAKKTTEQLQELKETLAICSHIEKVFFTATGDHFFTAHELLEKGEGTGKLYGYQKVKPVLQKVIGERRIYKHESVHTPNTLIMETLTRMEILEYDGPGDEEEGPDSSPARKKQSRKKLADARQLPEQEITL